MYDITDTLSFILDFRKEIKKDGSVFFMEKMKQTPIIAVDFDGTLCVDVYPNIGEANDMLICWLLKEKKKGSRIILWTCRCGKLLEEAVLWCKRQGLSFDAINENMEEITNRYGSDARKIYADIYIDDKSYWPACAKKMS